MKVADLQTNTLSANVEDQSTFAHLRGALEKWGMVELPVAMRTPDGGLRIVAGHHRVRAWGDLGNEVVECIVLPAGYLPTREDEFNLVNDLNRTRGQTSDSELVRVVRRESLAPERIEVHGLPKDLLMPRVQAKDLTAMDEEVARRGRILQLTQRVAREIAQVMLDELDEVVTCIVVDDKLAAVLRIPARSTEAGRRLALAMRARFEEAVADAIAQADAEVAAGIAEGT